MKRKISFIIICVFLLNITCVGFAQARNNGQNKSFIPPGLAHKYQKGQMLPPPFQKINESGVIEGKIVYKAKLNNNYWIVVKTDDFIKAFCLNNFQELNIGDVVQIEYIGARLINITLLEEDENQEEGDLSYSLSVSPLIINLGQKISFCLQIKNNNAYTVKRELGNEKAYDFVVKRNGVKIWQWSNGSYFSEKNQNVTFEPGRIKTYSETWKPEETGYYTVEAFYLGESATQPVKVKNFYVSEEAIQDFNPVLQLKIVKNDSEELLVLKVKNNLNRVVSYTFSEPLYDFWIKEGEKEIWRLSNGKNYTNSLKYMKFEPLEEKFYFTSYDFSKDKTYKAYASFKSNNINRIVGPVRINN